MCAWATSTLPGRGSDQTNLLYPDRYPVVVVVDLSRRHNGPSAHPRASAVPEELVFREPPNLDQVGFERMDTVNFPSHAQSRAERRKAAVRDAKAARKAKKKAGRRRLWSCCCLGALGRAESAAIDGDSHPRHTPPPAVMRQVTSMHSEDVWLSAGGPGSPSRQTRSTANSFDSWERFGSLEGEMEAHSCARRCTVSV